MVDEAVVEVEQEQLRTEMDESRTALVQKIEQLENKVSETVQNATATVADATATVMETVQNATNSVSETVGSVTSAVQGTVDTVRQSVEGTVDSVKETFDVGRQVRRHPWLMLAGATAVGYFGERVLQRSSTPQGSRPFPTLSRTVSARRNMEEGGSSPLDESVYQPFVDSAEVRRDQPNMSGTSARPQVSQQKPGFGEHLIKSFAPEVSKLQNLVLGMAMSAVRDAIVPAIPQPFQQPVDEIISDFTQKLGGQLATTPGAVKTAQVQNAVNTLNDA